MDEKPRVWLHQDELAIVRQKETLDRLAALQESVTKLAVILRDLVYVEALEDKAGHAEALSDHLDTLNAMIGDVPDEP